MSSVDSHNYEAVRVKKVYSEHKQRIKEAVSKIWEEPEKDSKKAKTRESLPYVMVNRKDISFWTLLKNCIGKDLTKIVFPVIMNEPISMLQRLCEYMEHHYVLDKAARADNPVERMEYVSGFVAAALCANWMRAGKPFNALLGETFELVRRDLGFTYVAEQVSHHPPVSAIHVTGEGYDFHTSVAPRLSFWGKSIDVTPKGIMVLELHKYKETYTWHNVHCYVHNIILGEMWMELKGQVNVTCTTSEMNAVLNFKESGWSNKDLHFVEGQIFKGKNLERAVYGSWITGMYSCAPELYDRFHKDTKTKTKLMNELRAEANKRLSLNLGLPVLNYNFLIPGQRTLWKAIEKPKNSFKYYNFSKFTMCLNELPNVHDREKLPPTDSRFRPDQRLFENGRIEEADAEKVRLEMEQRQRHSDGTDIRPLWFKYQRMSSTGKEDWVFDKSYFNRDWSRSPKIF